MRVREIVGDTQSAEIQQMRRSFNSLLRVLESISAQAGNLDITANEAFEVLAAVLDTGLDTDDPSGGVAARVGTQEELIGIRVTPTPLRKAQAKARVVEDDGTDA